MSFPRFKLTHMQYSQAPGRFPYNHFLQGDLRRVPRLSRDDFFPRSPAEQLLRELQPSPGLAAPYSHTDISSCLNDPRRRLLLADLCERIANVLWNGQKKTPTESGERPRSEVAHKLKNRAARLREPLPLTLEQKALPIAKAAHASLTEAVAFLYKRGWATQRPVQALKIPEPSALAEKLQTQTGCDSVVTLVQEVKRLVAIGIDIPTLIRDRQKALVAELNKAEGAVATPPTTEQAKYIIDSGALAGLIDHARRLLAEMRPPHNHTGA
jgi:hypothetical protein